MQTKMDGEKPEALIHFQPRPTPAPSSTKTTDHEHAQVLEMGQRAVEVLNNAEARTPSVTSITTIVAKSGNGQLVKLALLKDGAGFQIRLDEMRPDMFAIGADLRECSQLAAAHKKLTSNLCKQDPASCWLQKFTAIRAKRPPNQREMQVYHCMEDNLRTAWHGVLARLARRQTLLDEASKFYLLAEELDKRMGQTEELMVTGRAILAEQQVSGQAQGATSSADIQHTLLASIAALQEAFATLYTQTAELIRLTDSIGAQTCDTSAKMSHQLKRQINNHLYELTQKKARLELAQESISKMATVSNSAMSKAEQTQAGQPLEQAAEPFYQPLSPDQYPEECAGVAAELEQLLLSMNQNHELAQIGDSSAAAANLFAKHKAIKAQCLLLTDKMPTRQARAEERDLAQHSKLGGRNLLGARLWETIALIEARLNILQKAIGIFEMCDDSGKALDVLANQLKSGPKRQELFELIEKELDYYDIPAIIAAGTAFLSELIQYGRLLGAGNKMQHCPVRLNLRADGLLAVLRHLNVKLTKFKVDYLSQRLLFNRRNEDTSVQRFYLKPVNLVPA